jgi:hypothetical protein
MQMFKSSILSPGEVQAPHEIGQLLACVAAIEKAKMEHAAIGLLDGMLITHDEQITHNSNPEC